MKIISVHTPKTGGTSQLELYRRTFGHQAVQVENADDPANPASAPNLNPDGWHQSRPNALPEGIAVVHGHFPARKYENVQNASWVTFLRHPVSNIISIYFYWRSIPIGNAPTILLQYFRSNNLDILSMARLPLLRWLYSKSYFGGWNMDKMAFIGCYERRTEDLARFGDFLGVSFDPSLHLNPTSYEGIHEEREAMLADGNILRDLTEILADDISFYEYYTGFRRNGYY